MKRFLPVAAALLIGFLAGFFWKRQPVPVAQQVTPPQTAVPTGAPERVAPPVAPVPPAAAKPAPPAIVSSDDPVTRQELVKLLNEKNEQLAESGKSLADLDLKYQELGAKVAELMDQSQRLAASEKSLQERVDISSRLVENLQTELRTRDTRLAQVEVANQELRKKSDEAARKAARLTRSNDEMEELARRREVYITGILRRYREVTDMFRQLSLRQDSPRDTDLSRIQNAVTLADEDLRQLHALNAQMARLAKQKQ